MSEELNYPKLRAYQKGQFTKQYNNIKKMMSASKADEISKSEMDILKVRFAKLKEIHGRVTELHEYCLSALQSENEEDITIPPKESVYLDEIEEQLEEVTIYVQQTKRSDVDRKPSKDKDSETKDSFKIERIKFESFSGQNPRLYLAWKLTIKEKYLPRIEENGHGEAVFSLLQEPARSFVRPCNYRITEIWEELDRRYGDVRKISSIIVNEIKNLPAMSDDESDYGKFILFVDKVQLAYKELGQFGKVADIDNSLMLSFMERKLPPKLKAEWSEKVVCGALPDVGIFRAFMKFIKNKASAMEYQCDPLRMECVKSYDSKMNSQSHATGIGIIPRQNQNGNGRLDQGESVPRLCLIHFRTYSHETMDCEIFKGKSVFDRKKVILLNRACMMCLKRGHFADRCRESKPCPACAGQHNQLLCPGTDQTTRRNEQLPPQTRRTEITSHSTRVTDDEEARNGQHKTESTDSRQHMAETSMGLGQRLKEGKSILPIQSVITCNMSMPITTLFDTGSTHSLILNSTANILNLESLGSFIMNITKTGGDEESVLSEKYKLVLRGQDGSEYLVNAFGLRQISTSVKKIEMEVMEKLSNIVGQKVERPHGKIELLIGCDFAHLHPTAVQRMEQFVIGRNAFGLVVWGDLSTAFQTNACIINTVTHSAKISLDNFFQIETMGVQCQPKCGGCKCGKCPTGAKKYTIKEECQLKWIMDNLRYVDGHWETNYPWIMDPKLLPNNYLAAKGQLASLEKRLLKKPDLAKAYDDQVTDMMTRGVARPITKEEMNAYKGPVFYLGHHPVEKPSSASTPVRLVFNPARSFRGHILNEYWTVGANTVQSLLDVLLRMREYEYLVVGDIAKMYHSVHTTELEWHTHRFLWRKFDQSVEPTIFIFMRNSFGDRPAGTIATAAVWKTVEKFGKPYEMGSVALTDAIYVDDIIDSQPTRALAEKLTRETEELLAKGGFAVKGWKISGPQHKPERNDGALMRTLEADRVLGLRYDEKDDCFVFKINPGQKPGKVKIETEGKTMEVRECEYVTIEALLSGECKILTKKMLVAWVNGIFDVLGLASPFIVRAKILLRKITMYVDAQGSKLGWDSPVPEVLCHDWLEWFEDALDLTTVRFSRCISSDANLDKQPTLVMFSDASEMAMGCCAYVRWELKNKSNRAFLVTSKSRIAPLNICSIVRLELQAAVMSTRLAGTVKAALRLTFDRVIFIVDSEIVRAMIGKDSYGFNTFVATRVGEIRENTVPEQWFWIEGNSNIADWTTRGKRPHELGPESDWQRGPPFLAEATDKWPLKQSCVKLIPELRATVLNANIQLNRHLTKLCKMMDIEKVNSFHRLVRVTVRLQTAIEVPSYVERMKGMKGMWARIVEEPRVKAIRRAEMTWVLQAQGEKIEGKRSLLERVCYGDYKNLVPDYDDAGVCRARGRVFNDIAKAPILLPENHRLSRLIVQDVHLRNHDGISTVVTKVRERFWIIGVHRIAKAVRYKCVTCKKNFGKLGKQILGNPPPERLSVAAPFQFVALDYFGPYELKLPGKSTRGRTFIDEKQGYGVLFNCLSSRAVYCDVARGYDLEGFMLVYRRFQSIHGDPDVIYSDCGSQLTASDKFLHKDLLKKWDRDVLIRHGVKGGTEWRFNSPEAPWQNGISESLIKGVKRSLAVVLGTQHPKLTYDELQTVLFEVANTMNERPIGRHPTTPDESDFLRPNDLLTGRCSRRIRSGPWDVSLASAKKRFHMVQQVMNDWHKRWVRDYFPTLLPRRIWHEEQRDAQVGDLVIVKNTDCARGQWTLAQIAEVHPSRDGKVRNVTIRYKVHPPNEQVSKYRGSKDRTVKRAVQSLVVISPAGEP